MSPKAKCIVSVRHASRIGAGALLGLMMLTAAARADIVTRESDITGLRLGQRIYVDDGSCPAGQIKEITGMQLSTTGVLSVRKCVDRKGKR